MLVVLAVPATAPVELQAELHRGIEEALDRRERDDQRFRLVVEAQADLERRSRRP